MSPIVSSCAVGQGSCEREKVCVAGSRGEQEEGASFGRALAGAGGAHFVALDPNLLAEPVVAYHLNHRRRPSVSGLGSSAGTSSKRAKLLLDSAFT